MKNTGKIIFVSIIVILTVFLRFLSIKLSWFHLAPIAGISIFSGSILKNKWGYLLPLLAMFFSDLFLELFTDVDGFYSLAQIMTYGALALIAFLGTRLNPDKPLKIFAYTLSGSLIFFVLSNLGVFFEGHYGYSLQGLADCYMMALPFYKSELATNFFVNALLSDLLFSIIAFGSYHFILSQRHKEVFA